MRYPRPPYAERREFHRPFSEALSAEIERITNRVLVRMAFSTLSNSMPKISDSTQATLTLRHRERDDFLHDLELRERKLLRADAVRGDLQ